MNALRGMLLLVMSGCAMVPSKPLPRPSPAAVRHPQLPLPPTPPTMSPDEFLPASASATMRTDDMASVIALLTPAEVLQAAAQARADVDGHSGRGSDKPPDTDRMAALARRLDAAVATMRAHETAGRYQAGDVLATRAALIELRGFLSSNGP